MTLYARSDVIRVHVPGADHPHERPLVSPDDPEQGYAPVWGINCLFCEAHLHDDVQWSKTVAKIPLTPDEEEELRDAEEAMKVESQRQAAAAARDMAAARLAEARSKAPTAASGPDAVITDASGSVIPPKVTETPSEPAAPEPTADEDDDEDEGGYSDMTKADLKDLARERGLGVGGTKDDLVDRLVDYDREHAQ